MGAPKSTYLLGFLFNFIPVTLTERYSLPAQTWPPFRLLASFLKAQCTFTLTIRREVSRQMLEGKNELVLLVFRRHMYYAFTLLIRTSTVCGILEELCSQTDLLYPLLLLTVTITRWSRIRRAPVPQKARGSHIIPLAHALISFNTS